MWRSLLAGAVIAPLAVFPLAALIALVFRFPVPFAGYLSGVEAARLSPIAVFFYGQLGGFPFLILGGTACGYLGFRLGRPVRRRVWQLTIALPVMFSAACVLALALLDKIIGPW